MKYYDDLMDRLYSSYDLSCSISTRIIVHKAQEWYVVEIAMI